MAQAKDNATTSPHKGEILLPPSPQHTTLSHTTHPTQVPPYNSYCPCNDTTTVLRLLNTSGLKRTVTHGKTLQLRTCVHIEAYRFALGLTPIDGNTRPVPHADTRDNSSTPQNRYGAERSVPASPFLAFLRRYTQTPE